MLTLSAKLSLTVCRSLHVPGAAGGGLLREPPHCGAHLPRRAAAVAFGLLAQRDSKGGPVSLEADWNILSFTVSELGA